jgi:hypothetical protein
VGSFAGLNTTSSAVDNSIFGTSAGNTLTSGGNNTILGARAGFGMTDGKYNTIIGSDSGRNGSNNVIVGSASGTSITTGEYNTILGSDCGIALTEGSDNVIIGRSAGDSLSGTAGQNVLIGPYAGEFMTTGINNICIGQYATSDGSTNISIGSEAGTGVSGQRNICIGEKAGYGTDEIGTTGEYNIMMGINVAGRMAFNSTYIGDTLSTGTDLSTASSVLENTIVGRTIEIGTFDAGTTYVGNVRNVTAIGSEIQIRPSGGAVGPTGIANVIVMGHQLKVSRNRDACMFGRKSTLTTQSNVVTMCNSNNFVTLSATGDFTVPGDAFKPGGGSWTSSSDRRLKSNIQTANMIMCENIVRNLDLKRFTWNTDFNPLVTDRTQLGFIAQEVEEFLPKSVLTREFEGLPDCKLLDVSQITMIMYGVLKRCMTRIDDLEAIITRNNFK